MSNDNSHDVVIVGLGPTGLVLAHCLGLRGHRVLVLEREPAFYGNARAVYTDGECMRIFQSFGMAERLAADMLQDAPVQMLLPDGRVLFQLKNTHRPHGWPTNNFFYQPLLETALADGLAKYPNVTVLRGRDVTRFEQDASGVDVFHVAGAEAKAVQNSAHEANLKVAQRPQAAAVEPALPGHSRRPLGGRRAQHASGGEP